MKRAMMDSRHEYILSAVAQKLSMEHSDVEECILEENQARNQSNRPPSDLKRTLVLQIEIMEQFFAANGSHRLMFYYEKNGETSVDESSSHPRQSTATTKSKHHLYVTDGTRQAFTGLSVFFLRTTPKAITTANISQVSIGT